MESILLFEAVDLTVLSRTLIIIIICGFMPFTAMSYFWFMLPKKEKEYSKALREMGIQSSRKVRDTHAPARYILPLAFATLICFLAIGYIAFADMIVDGLNDSLLLTSTYFGTENRNVVNQSLAVLTFAFLGAFLWSAQNIIRRLIAYDLSPSVYYSAAIRIFLAAAVALVFSFFLGKDSGTNVLSFKASLPAIAFLTGMFPERIISYLINIFKRYVDGDTINNQQLSLYNIEGISMQHKERLEEIGIDNAQNLATASLTQLLIDTPFSARQLLDWIGQAKLLCYVKDDISKLRGVGIRSVFDFYKGEKSEDTLYLIADAAGINSSLLRVVSDQVRDDEGIKSLYHFQHRLDSPRFDHPTENT